MRTIHILTIAAMTMLAANAAVPHISIPFTDNPPSLGDGVEQKVWQEAAIVRRIFPKGSSAVPQHETEFRLCYDHENLYVMARCFESQTGYPEAYRRPWHDLLFNNDDAIQIVLGVANPKLKTREIINMGGYEGAMGTEVAKADDYYQFTINACNSRQRTYNEIPLETADFDSSITVIPNSEWRVSMCIPFSSCGLKPKAGGRIYGNLFRFRPPQMLGWHLPGFGGYVPMPFGEFEFLPEGPKGSVEEFPQKPVPVAQEQVKPKCTATVHYGPLSGVIAAEIHKEGINTKLTATMEVTDFPTQVVPLEFRANGQAFVYQDFNPKNQKLREAHVVVKNEAGEIVAEASRSCEPVEVPEWLGTDAGADYIDKKIPAPWQQPTVDRQTVTLLDKSLQFNGNALPAQVTFAKDQSPLFAAAPYIRYHLEEQSFTFTGTQADVRLDGIQARVVGKQLSDNSLRLEAKSHIDYDGFMDCKFAISGDKLERISRLQVIFPLAEGVAKYILPDLTCQSAGALTGAGFRGHSGIVWVGNEEKGLCFSYDESPFRGNDLRHHIEIRQTQGGDQLVLNLVDATGQLKDGNALFRFFLLPTPSKPYPTHPVRSRYTWLWENWSRFHGYPDLTKIDDLKQKVQELANQGKALTLYCCQGLQQDTPEMQAYRTDFEMLPKWRYYYFHGQDCFATCKRGPEGDLQLHHYRQLIKETGISGIVSDGLTVNWLDSNPLHHGCGRPYTVTLDNDTPSHTILTRRFLKRMRGLFNDTDRPFCIVAHTGGGIDPMTLSFADAYFEGEQLTRYRRGYNPSQAMFTVGYSGLPWGWRAIYWGKQIHNYNGIASAVCYSLLFNSEYMINPNTEPIDFDVKLLEEYSGHEAEFHPFWKKHTAIDFQSDACLASLYLNKEKAMLVVSNLTNVEKFYSVNLSKLFDGKPLYVKDALLEKNVKLQDNSLLEKLPPFSCRILLLRTTPWETAPQAAPPFNNPFEINGFHAEDWKTQRDVTFNEGQLVMQGDVQKPAEIVLKRTIGQNLRFSMAVKLCDRFRLTFGPCNLTIGGGWPGYGWMVTGPSDPYGRGWVYQAVPRRPNDFVNFTFDLTNGVLNVYYDDQCVVSDLPFILPPSGNAFKLFVWHTDRLEAKDLHLKVY